SWSNISGEKTENSRGGYDYWVVKTDSSGNVQWDKTMGSSTNDWTCYAYQTKDNGYIIGGSSDSYPGNEQKGFRRGNFDYWLIKLDSLQNIQWDKTIGGGRLDQLTSLQQTIDGGYILGGYSESAISYEKSEKNRGDNDYWLVKTNEKGEVQW